MAFVTERNVVYWKDIRTVVPILTNSESKAQRLKLFKDFDSDDDGLLHIRDAVRAFFRLLPRVRGIVDMKPVWTQTFRIARDSVEPVVDIGIDFMDQNQFRVYTMCLWYYLKLWDGSVGELKSVVVRSLDIPRVVDVFKDTTVDCEVLERRLHGFFSHRGEESAPFDEFADYCLRQVLPIIAEEDGKAEKAHALREIEKVQPQLLQKQQSRGIHQGKDADTLQPHMTGFNANKISKGARHLGMMKMSFPDIQSGPGVPQVTSQQWKTQYMVQYAPPGKFDSDAAYSQRRDSPPTNSPSCFPPKLKSSSSLPQIPRSSSRPVSRQMDKQGLRVRFDEKPDACSTVQMRSFLQGAAGQDNVRYLPAMHTDLVGGVRDYAVGLSS